MANTCKFTAFLLFHLFSFLGAEDCTDCRYVVKKFLLVHKNYSVITQMKPEEKFEMLISKTNLGRSQSRLKIFTESFDELKNWFINESGNDQNNVEDRICIPKYCCPKQHFGAECLPCEQCDINGGFCDGSGLKSGSGKCRCRPGFTGILCDECNLLTHYKKDSDDGFTCNACDISCTKGCSGPNNSDCTECAKGFELQEDKTCKDVDECKTQDPCESKLSFCVNTPGSYVCQKCDRACKGCYTGGPENCIDCALGYEYDGEKCVDIDECEHLPCTKQNQECKNLPGSFECQCAKGFEKFEDHCIKRPNGGDIPGQERTKPKKPKIIWTVNFFKEFCKMVFSLLGLALFSKLIKGYIPVVIVSAFANGYFIYKQSIHLDDIYNNQR